MTNFSQAPNSVTPFKVELTLQPRPDRQSLQGIHEVPECQYLEHGAVEAELSPEIVSSHSKVAFSMRIAHYDEALI
jgi:hypothetical protein